LIVEERKLAIRANDNSALSENIKERSEECKRDNIIGGAHEEHTWSTRGAHEERSDEDRNEERSSSTTIIKR